MLKRLWKIDPRLGFLTGVFAVFVTPVIALSIWTWILDWWDPIDDLFWFSTEG